MDREILMGLAQSEVLSHNADNFVILSRDVIIIFILFWNNTKNKCKREAET